MERIDGWVVSAGRNAGSGETASSGSGVVYVREKLSGNGVFDGRSGSGRLAERSRVVRRLPTVADDVGLSSGSGSAIGCTGADDAKSGPSSKWKQSGDEPSSRSMISSAVKPQRCSRWRYSGWRGRRIVRSVVSELRQEGDNGDRRTVAHHELGPESNEDASDSVGDAGRACGRSDRVSSSALGLVAGPGGTRLLPEVADAPAGGVAREVGHLVLLAQDALAELEQAAQELAAGRPAARRRPVPRVLAARRRAGSAGGSAG